MVRNVAITAFCLLRKKKNKLVVNARTGKVVIKKLVSVKNSNIRKMLELLGLGVAPQIPLRSDRLQNKT